MPGSTSNTKKISACTTALLLNMSRALQPCQSTRTYKVLCECIVASVFGGGFVQSEERMFVADQGTVYQLGCLQLGAHEGDAAAPEGETAEAPATMRTPAVVRQLATKPRFKLTNKPASYTLQLQ